MTLAEMRRRMSSDEFASWIAFDRMNPIGDRRIDTHFARLMALIASGLGGRPVKGGRFDVFSDRRFTVSVSAGRSVEDQKAAAVRVTRLLGGKVTGHHGDDR